MGNIKTAFQRLTPGKKKHPRSKKVSAIFDGIQGGYLAGVAFPCNSFSLTARGSHEIDHLK